MEKEEGGGAGREQGGVDVVGEKRGAGRLTARCRSRANDGNVTAAVAIYYCTIRIDRSGATAIYLTTVHHCCFSGVKTAVEGQASWQSDGRGIRGGRSRRRGGPTPPCLLASERVLCCGGKRGGEGEGRGGGREGKGKRGREGSG